MTKKLDILLINPGGTKKLVYQELNKDFSAVSIPFWAALTAGFIRKNGFEVNILDASAENLSYKETAEKVEELNPKFTCIIVYGQQANVSSPIMHGVRNLCKEIKTLNKNRILILSGWHVSALPKRTLEKENCDFVVQGEGFYSLLGLLKNQSFENIPGLWWKNKDGCTLNVIPPQNVENLTHELNNVAWDLLPMKKGLYRTFNWLALSDLKSRTKCAEILTSLGCPHKCSFCAIHTIYGRKMRYWNPEWVLNQIDILVNEYGVKHINFNDECFTLNPKHYLPIAEGLIKRNYELNLCVFARVDSIRKEHLETLKKAGFNWFKLGIESSKKEILERSSKGNYDVEDVRNVVKETKNAGINLCANFMFGLPGDNFESMQDTLNLAIELNPEFPSFFATMAIPGSDLYDIAKNNLIPLPDDKDGPGWIGYSSQGYEFLPLPTENLSSKEVLAFRDYAFNTFFKNPRYLKYMEDRYGKEVREHLEAMTEIQIQRRILKKHE